MGVDINGHDLPIHRPETSYNNDVAIPLYEGALMSYHGARRKGIRGERPPARSVPEHIGAALDAHFFLEQQTPLPASLVDSVKFSATAPAGSIKVFRGNS